MRWGDAARGRPCADIRLSHEGEDGPELLRAQEERDAVGAGTAGGELAPPADAQDVRRPGLGHAEAAAGAAALRVAHADLHAAVEGEAPDAEVAHALHLGDRRAVVAGRAAIRDLRSRRRCQHCGAEHQRDEQQALHATALLARSSCPKRARATYCPIPAEATSSSPSTSTLPRSSTTSGEPVTSVPS